MKPNKYLVLFVGLFLGLSTMLFAVLQKYFPLFLHHIIYYCQEMAKTLSFRLPGNIGVLVFSLLLVILLTALIKFGMTVAKIYKLRKHLSGNSIKNTSLTEILDKLDLKSRVAIVKSPKPYALCFGVRNPKIYLSTKLLTMLSPKELEIVLKHEKSHLEHRDNLILLIATFIESLFPFFPILTDLIRIYKTDRELFADQAAIQRKADKHSLSVVLKKLLQYEPVTQPALAPAIADMETLETRIKSLLSIKVNYIKLGKRNLINSAIFVAILVGLMTTPIQARELHDNGLDLVVICNKNVSCESTCNDDSFTRLHSSQQIYSPGHFSTSN